MNKNYFREYLLKQTGPSWFHDQGLRALPIKKLWEWHCRMVADDLLDAYELTMALLYNPKVQLSPRTPHDPTKRNENDA